MPTFPSAKPLVSITLGDPAGVGPEVVVRALEHSSVRSRANFVVLGPSQVYKDIAQKLRSSIRFQDIGQLSEMDGLAKSVIPCYFPFRPEQIKKRGHAQAALTRMAVQSIELSVKLAMSRECHAVVTAPINKAGLKKAGFDIPGHTEFMASLSKTKKFEMMLVGGPLRVVLVTRHAPLQKVSSLLSRGKIVETILLTDKELRRSFGIAKPRIVVAGLNPHAGEEGTIGSEEVDIISPAVQMAKKRCDAKIFGPLSPDALFYEAYQGKYDAVVCMYHDQGLIPLKMISRGHGVNVTLGLPFVRTSPDHGTAYDIVSKFSADSGSMEEAIRLGVEISQRRLGKS